MKLKKVLTIGFLSLLLFATSYTVAFAYGTIQAVKEDYHYGRDATNYYNHSYYYNKSGANFFSKVTYQTLNKDGTNGTMKTTALSGTVYDDSQPFWRDHFWQDGKGNVKGRSVVQHGEGLRGPAIPLFWNGNFSYKKSNVSTYIVSDYMGAAGNYADQIHMASVLYLR